MMYRNDHYGPIDRFCAKHPRLGISNLAMYIAIGPPRRCPPGWAPPPG